jgi:hypothetical protein
VRNNLELSKSLNRQIFHLLYDLCLPRFSLFSVWLSFFFCGRRRCIKPAFLQKDPEEQKNYKEALLLDPDEDEELGPSVARRCRCSASRLG